MSVVGLVHVSSLTTNLYINKKAASLAEDKKARGNRSPFYLFIIK